MKTEQNNVMDNFKIIKIDDDTISEHAFLLNTKLKDLQAKFIAKISKSQRIFFDNVKKFGKEKVVFGAKYDDTNKAQNLIYDLSAEKNTKPIKIIKDKYGRLFALNTARAVAYLRKYGHDVELKQLPFFLIDFSQNDLVIFDYNGALESQRNLEAVLDSAKRTIMRIENGWRSVGTSYTVGKLEKELFKMLNDNNPYVFE